ncbi:hypothetical protein GLAREA_09038 [Glarea lozoyensis ATCC 20868]|uniref:Uncharacterized protein n=1 Tax=Glarea lozoyensis (strain ATCC 20868 / MF5171) TaxID=1116229 RepID=S3DGR4_GLAL2|nr:uncharacterized protein GLAREA_09038 [Glarea lozoyensis ATCC 20868]EPE36875.1 hypothetical protein GLAREA_09038 [Glarea lozoyensis ATCC 20868]
MLTSTDRSSEEIDQTDNATHLKAVATAAGNQPRSEAPEMSLPFIGILKPLPNSPSLSQSLSMENPSAGTQANSNDPRVSEPWIPQRVPTQESRTAKIWWKFQEVRAEVLHLLSLTILRPNGRG